MSYPIDELAARRRSRDIRSSQSELIQGYQKHLNKTDPNVAYENNEAALYQRQVREIEKAPLAERQEAAREFFEAMRDNPELVAERIGWVLNGSMGWGAMQAAKRVVRNPRTNRAAVLTHMVGALDWRCPQRQAIGGWKKLSPEEKKALDRAINAEIKSAESAE